MVQGWEWGLFVIEVYETALQVGSLGWYMDPGMVLDHGVEQEEDRVEVGRRQSPSKSRAWRQGRNQG